MVINRKFFTSHLKSIRLTNTEFYSPSSFKLQNRGVNMKCFEVNHQVVISLKRIIIYEPVTLTAPIV